jgi:hypothetical protein
MSGLGIVKLVSSLGGGSFIGWGLGLALLASALAGAGYKGYSLGHSVGKQSAQREISACQGHIAQLKESITVMNSMVQKAQAQWAADLEVMRERYAEVFAQRAKLSLELAKTQQSFAAERQAELAENEKTTAELQLRLSALIQDDQNDTAQIKALSSRLAALGTSCRLSPADINRLR